MHWTHHLRVAARQDASTYYDSNRVIAERLLQNVWGFRAIDNVEKPKAAACFNHYERILNNRHLFNENADLRESPQQSSDATELVTYLRAHAHQPLSGIHSYLASNCPNWIRKPADETTLDNVIRSATHLWLFTRPDLSDKSRTLTEAVRIPLENLGGTSSSWLWLDFSAEMLERKAHFQWRWTSDITEHLTFVSRHEVRIFAHACVMERYHHRKGPESKIYPPGLLSEYLKTMNLLWPMEHGRIAKRVKKMEKVEFIDIEVGMNHYEKFNLGAYKYFGARLAKMQESFEVEDRRRGGKMVLSIAAYGIALTAFFGLISAATGLASMYASLKQIQAI